MTSRWRSLPGSASRHTSSFSNTRVFDGPTFDGLPLGARMLPLNAPGVKGGYVYGKADAPRVLVTHGWGLDSSILTGLGVQLAGVGALSIDAPQHGVNPGTESTLMAYTKAIEAVLREVPSIEMLVLHSLSSVAGLAAAQRSETNIRSIVMVAPPLSLVRVLQRWSAERDMSVAMVNKVKAELHRRNGVPVDYWDVNSRSEGLRCRISLVFDPYDPIVPAEDASTIRSAGMVRPDDILEIPNSGHIGLLNDPATVAFVKARMMLPVLAEELTYD